VSLLIRSCTSAADHLLSHQPWTPGRSQQLACRVHKPKKPLRSSSVEKKRFLRFRPAQPPLEKILVNRLILLVFRVDFFQKKKNDRSWFREPPIDPLEEIKF
jgi:hypothetical protein